MTTLSRRKGRSERGVALIEVALTLPLVLLVSVSIFEFGRAFQTWQVLTNAAREGARVAVLPSSDPDEVRQRVKNYMRDGQLGNWGTAVVDVVADTVSIGPQNVSASRVTVTYPFNFIVLNPVARLVTPGSSLGGAPLSITASAAMRNESGI
jgi:Flp pilus assembly protein TadG